VGGITTGVPVVRLGLVDNLKNGAQDWQGTNPVVAEGRYRCTSFVYPSCLRSRRGFLMINEQVFFASSVLTSEHFRSERSYGHFGRSIPLSDGAQTDQSKAEMKNGVPENKVLLAETKQEKVQIPIDRIVGQRSRKDDGGCVKLADVSRIRRHLLASRRLQAARCA
jgi:Hsp20/alpha crystallin family